MKTIIWWIRRDFRLFDNPTLRYALENGERVLPVFIHDNLLNTGQPSNRHRFLDAALIKLDEKLRSKGSRLIIRTGLVSEELQRVFKNSNAKLIVAESDFSPYATLRDKKIMDLLPIQFIHGLTVFPPGVVRKRDGSPYRSFTPFSRAWQKLPQPGAEEKEPEKLPPVPESIHSNTLPQAISFPDFPADESSAIDRLHTFLSGPICSYGNNRNLLSIRGTAKISPYFKLGLLSMRYTINRVQKLILSTEDQAIQKNCIIWMNELIWREFYFNILFHYPYVTKQAFRENMRSIPWRDDPSGLKSWKDGLTGYPIVDAGMRQLKNTGWMHNRARMIVASFLTKDLLIDWRQGEIHFMEYLIDGDPACNNGGWQWSAGTGTDAAPYFRIFNPVLQSKKFDKDGDYIRTYIPELRNVPNQFIHEPWKHSDIQLTYPKPIVNHHEARIRTLEAYKLSKNRI